MPLMILRALKYLYSFNSYNTLYSGIISTDENTELWNAQDLAKSHIRHN